MVSKNKITISYFLFLYEKKTQNTKKKKNYNPQYMIRISLLFFFKMSLENNYWNITSNLFKHYKTSWT